VPIYDYRCDHCGHAFSAVQSFKDEPLEKCPSCGKRPRRLIVASAVVFKGSGWYKTDSRGKAPKEDGAPASTDAKSETKSEAKGETKTETKSETKAETKSETKAETKTGSKPAESKPASETKS
jgi:putative FmdB family regulatory protein